MSKAILVMDMPKSCRECDLRVIGSCNFCTGAGGRKIDQMKIINNDIKPDWCPLCEVPQKQTVHCTDTTHHRFAKDGWNHCIDTIIKEGTDKDVEDNTSLCKWQWGLDYAQVECMGDRILFESRRLFTYCPYCGKKIEEIR